MTKQNWLFERDEKGELLPKKVFIKSLNEEVLVTPVTWIEITRLRTKMVLQTMNQKLEGTEEEELNIIVNHCKNPVFSIDEAKVLFPYIKEELLKAIYGVSNIEFTKSEESGRDVPK